MPMKTTPMGARMAASYSTSSAPCRASRQLPPAANHAAPPAAPRAPAVPAPEPDATLAASAALRGAAAAPAPDVLAPAVLCGAGVEGAAGRSQWSWLHSQPPWACTHSMPVNIILPHAHAASRHTFYSVIHVAFATLPNDL